MNTAEKIIYYTQTKWCIPFRDLHHTVNVVCEFVKPIYPEIEPNKYLEYFLNNINFDTIDKNPTKQEGLKNCKVLYWGLDQMLKNDIDKVISEFQMNLSGRRTFELVQIQNKLIDLCGLLKRQSRTNKQGISFAQRFNSLYQNIESKETLFPIDYQILIREFNEAILNDLLSSYEILNDTINVKFPLPIETKIELHKGSQKVNAFRKKYNSEIESIKPFLLSKGLILPNNYTEFLFWLLEVKYKQEQFFPLPEFTDIEFFEYSQYRESQIDGIVRTTEKQPKVICKIDPIDLIKDPTKLAFYEDNLKIKIENWKAGKDKTGCAVFCNILYKKDQFCPNLIKTAIDFAFNRYNGLEIEIMIKKIRKKDSLDKYKKEEDEMDRLMVGIKYGKI